MYSVIIVSDHLGRTIQILHPGDDLLASPGIRYSVAFQSDDLGEVVRAADLIKRRLRAERCATPESVWEELGRAAIAQDEHTRTA